MKLLNLLLLLVAIELSLIMFLGITTPSSSLVSLATNSQNWSNLALINQLQLIIAGLGTAVIIVGLFVGAKSDFLIMAPLVTVLLTYGATFYQVYQVIIQHSQFNSNNYIAIIAITPFIIAYVYTLIKFWRGND